MIYSFTVHGAPIAKGRPRFSVRGGKVRTYTPAKTSTHEENIAWQAKQAIKRPLEGAVGMEIVTYHPIPKSASKALKQAMRDSSVRPTTKPDADNILKLVADALNGIAYKDDKQIVHAGVAKHYGAPRTEIVVWDI